VGNCLRLSGVDWQEYTRLLRIFAERPGLRLTYDRGELEIMSPLLEHDKDGHVLFLLIHAASDELGLPLFSGGSTTIRRRKGHRGLEPDECVWLANAPRVMGKRRLDLRVDPPPDLAVEVDATRSSLNRMSIYATLGVPEVWRLDGDTLTFLMLTAGNYQPTPNSLSFPMIAPADLLPFIQQGRQGDENAVVRAFRAWFRQRLAPPAP
jgi:Uma2 family endonuclease